MAVYMTERAVTAQAMQARDYLSEYNEILMGNKKSFSTVLTAKSQSPKLCAELLRLIFTTYMQWSPVEIRDKLTPDVVAAYKLGPLVRKIPCPPEVDRNRELYYVAWYLYPETRNVRAPELVVKLYNDLLNNRVKKYPNNYFDGNDGYLRAKILFLTMVREYLSFSSLEELYRFFSTTQGRACLEKYKLSMPLKELYDTPLDYLHDALPSHQKDEDLYHRYSSERLVQYDQNGYVAPADEDSDEDDIMEDEMVENTVSEEALVIEEDEVFSFYESEYGQFAFDLEG